MAGIDATAQFIPAFWGMVALLAVSVGGIIYSAIPPVRRRTTVRRASLGAVAAAPSPAR